MRWVRRIAVGVFAIIVVALVVIYAGSEWIIRQKHDVSFVSIAADRSPAAVAEGQRLARIESCLSCHGPEGKGRLLVDAWPIGHFTAPALAEVAAQYDDRQLERAIRQGTAADGTTLFIMPTHRHTSDKDIAAIIGWLRTLKPAPDDIVRRRNLGPLGRLLILKGEISGESTPERLSIPDRGKDVGAYFANAVCLGCHELYKPNEVKGEIAPPLAMVAAAYDDAGFQKLLRTGVPASGKDLGLMSEQARRGFHLLTDQEIAGIHAWLIAENAKAPPQ